MANRVNNPHRQRRPLSTPVCFSSKRIRVFGLALLLLSLTIAFKPGSQAQAGGHKLFGDLRVDESKADGAVPLSYDVLLYSRSGNILQRVSIPNRGRYQFLNVSDGEYDVVVEVENKVVARLRVSMYSPFKTDFRQDIELVWRPSSAQIIKTSTISAEDFYKRPDTNEKLFIRSQRLTSAEKYEQAIPILRQILESDPQDFQAWTELGTAYLGQQAYDSAEKSYSRAIQVRPAFFLANLNLGRLYFFQQRFDEAARALVRALKVKPQSADANYFLGETYLQLRQGSAAVGYLNEALRLDPLGKADVHLRLALLYNGARMKDKAALEYEQFLKKRPDYPQRKKLEKYIADNKKRQAGG